MTKNEAAAVTVVLNWIFGKGGDYPAVLQQACVRLAEAAHRHGQPWNQERVLKERW